MSRFSASASLTAALVLSLPSGGFSDTAPAPEPAPFVVQADADWAPYSHQVEVEAGSVFDFSFLSDAPAGKHGALRVSPEGRFEFENLAGKRARFWGVNLCFSAAFPEPAEADRLVARLARSGYNSIRLHHFDRELVARVPDYASLDTERLEQIDYLFAAAKREGLYINIDLFSLRPFPRATLESLGIDPSLDIAAQFKALVPLSDAAFEEWARFARQLLTHKNPHTGLTWAEDPALIGICPVNEDTLLSWYARAPKIKQRYEAAFADWSALAENEPHLERGRDAAFSRFIHELQVRSDARLHAFLRSLGTQALLTGANFMNGQGLSLLRQHYDYVDNHQYWDHPKRITGRWSLPFGFNQTSATQQAAGTPRLIMPTRIFNKPFVVTEFNYVRPDRHRAESAVLMPSYASLQDWDALYRFDYASNKESALNGGFIGTFALTDDPIALLADRVGALVFLRNDVAPARHAIAFRPDAARMFDRLNQPYPETFSNLGLISRIGTFTTEPPAGVALIDDDPWNPGTLRVLAGDVALEAATATTYRSDTGQIELRTTEGSVTTVTAHSELFVLPAGAALSGTHASLKNGDEPASVAIVSTDRLPLSETQRILVMHLTDSLPDGMTFADKTRTELRTRGQLPHLVLRGELDVTLRGLSDGAWKAWAVDATGKRTREIPVSRSGTDLSFKAQTVTDEGSQLAYELIRE